MLYNIAKNKLLTEDLTVGLKAMLVTDAYVFDASHEAVLDVDDSEFNHANYSRQTVANVSLIDNGASFAIDGDDLEWTKLTGTVGGIIFFYDGFLLSYNSAITILDNDNYIVKLSESGIVEVNK